MRLLLQIFSFEYFFRLFVLFFQFNHFFMSFFFVNNFVERSSLCAPSNDTKGTIEPRTTKKEEEDSPLNSTI